MGELPAQLLPAPERHGLALPYVNGHLLERRSC